MPKQIDLAKVKANAKLSAKVLAFIILLNAINNTLNTEPPQVAVAQAIPEESQAVMLDEPTSSPIIEEKDWIESDQAQAMIDEINLFLKEQGSAPELQGSGKIWVEYGVKYNRHPFSAVAISLADTSLGKNLKTAYNYGNVGNWDDGRTTAFTSREQGIESIYKAMTNSYLKNATKLCHLSVGGWDSCPEGKTINGGKFYASSPVNWNRNTNWAMSWMLGTEYRTDHSVILSDYLD